MDWVYATIHIETPSKRIVWLLIICLGAGYESSAQSETSSFGSLRMQGNAQLSALGGVNVSLTNQNVNFFQSNPALSTDTLNGWASVSHLFYFASVGLSNFSYQHKFDRFGSVAFGFQNLSLGSIDGFDLSGNATQSFNSGESIIFLGKSHEINNFRVGINAKGVFSNLAGYRASAILFDIGGSFSHPTQDLSVGLTIKNIGFVLNEFSSSSSSQLPFDVQAGATYKPEHMPLRVSITAYNLAGFNIAYVDSLRGRPEPSALDKVVQHLAVGAEVLLHRNVSILLGYNFLRHNELKLEEVGGGAGFSVGAMAKVKNLNFGFSRSGYVTGGAWQVSLSVDTKRILKKRSI